MNAGALRGLAQAIRLQQSVVDLFPLALGPMGIAPCGDADG